MSSKQIMALVESQHDQIATALPAGVNVDRVVRMVRTVVSTSDIIQKCTPRSVLGSVITMAQLGLEPGVTAHLVPFYDSRNKVWNAQMIADYRGLMQLARRSGHISRITARVVREGDAFEYEEGAEPRLVHRPILGNPGQPIAVYAVAKWRDSGDTQFEVLPWSEVEKVRGQSLAKIKKDYARQYSPWVTSEDEMARKTAIRRLCKYLPSSTEDAGLQRAIVLDEAADRGEQNLGATIEGEAVEVTDEDVAQPLSEQEERELADAIDGAREA